MSHMSQTTLVLLLPFTVPVFLQLFLKIFTSIKEEQITFRFLEELVTNITVTEREK